MSSLIENNNEIIQVITGNTNKKYYCECIDCIGEWTGVYSNIEDLEKDIMKYCRSGKATFRIVEESPI